MARTRRTGNDSGPFASFAPFAAKDLGWPKGICSMPRRGSLVCSALCALLLLSSPAAPQSRKPKSPLRFRVTLSEQIAPKATSGRLLVLMTDAPQEVQTIRSGFIPGSTWIAATEIEHFAPGAAIELDPDLKAYPKPFSEARPGTYQMMGSRYHNARGCCVASGVWQRAEEDIRGRLPHSRFRRRPHGGLAGGNSTSKRDERGQARRDDPYLSRRFVPDRPPRVRRFGQQRPLGKSPDRRVHPVPRKTVPPGQ